MRAKARARAANKAEDDEASMGKRWVRRMHKNGNKEWVTALAIGAAACVKWAISLGSYSGESYLYAEMVFTLPTKSMDR